MKIIEIESCFKCPYCSDDMTCTAYDDHPEIPETSIEEMVFPDFCFLVNKEDYIEANFNIEDND